MLQRSYSEVARNATRTAHVFTVEAASAERGPLMVKLVGRAAQTMLQLIKAGRQGITAADFPPGCRLAAYVHALRTLGIDIVSPRERHAGPYPGNHVRYVLRDFAVYVGPMPF